MNNSLLTKTVLLVISLAGMTACKFESTDDKGCTNVFDITEVCIPENENGGGDGGGNTGGGDNGGNTGGGDNGGNTGGGDNGGNTGGGDNGGNTGGGDNGGNTGGGDNGGNTNAPDPEIISPEPNSRFSGAAVTFKRSQHKNLDKWKVVVTDSNNNEIESAMLSTAEDSVTMGNLPTDGRLLMVRFSFLIDGQWDSTDYNYTAFTKQDSGGNTVPGDLNCGKGNYALENNGPMRNRVNMALVGDGYTAAEIDTTYSTGIKNFITHMLYRNMFENPHNLSEAHRKYRKFINVCQINLISKESGMDITKEGKYVDTALDISIGPNGFPSVNAAKVDRLFNNLKRETGFEPNWKAIALNSPEKKYAVVGRYMFWTPNFKYLNSAVESGLHEAGHEFHGLGDEYGGACKYDRNGANSKHNLSTNPSGKKWQHWIGYHQPGVGVIGVYEGGYYCNTGVYRPSPKSKMLRHAVPYDAVAREKIVLDIYEIVDPMDTWTDNKRVLNNPTNLEVKVVDPDIIKVQWFVDNKPVATGTRLNVAGLNLSPGKHRIRARAYDDTKWVRVADRSSLEQTVEWQVEISR